MTDQPTEGASLGAVMDALVAGMTTAQFDELAQRTGHKSDQEQAAEALSRFQRQQNLADGNANEAAVLAAFKRKGR